MKTLLLFDIDGTLLQAKYAGRKALARAFREAFGVTDFIEGIDFTGRTDPELFQDAAVRLLGHCLDEAEWARLTEAFFAAFPRELERCIFTIKPGIPELLPLLAKMENVILGIQTGNLEPSAWMKLKFGGMDDYFQFGGFGSDHGDRTEMVRIAIQKAQRLYTDTFHREHIYVIGDTEHDIRAGKDLGVKTIAVSTGTVTAENLQAESPDFFFADLGDIPAFLKCIDCEAS